MLKELLKSSLKLTVLIPFYWPGFLTLTREESVDWEAINDDILNKFDTMKHRNL